jgi:ABC-type phosphate/phosphonate transport system substrate-binding protein
VASGEQLVVLLDQTQAAALPTLPFASSLQAVLQSPEMPVTVIAVVDNRLPAARAKAFQAGLLKMGKATEGADTLGSLKLQGFVLPQLPGGEAKPLTGKRPTAITKP